MFSLNLIDTMNPDVAGPIAMLLHKGGKRIVVDRKPEKSAKIDTFEKIRCPLCCWTPDRFSLWTCWNVAFPEYFFDGCGTEWNTFDTRGVCPTCSHQWQWTSCLSCWGWSRHEDWYER
jgi:hypothetical protein